MCIKLGTLCICVCVCEQLKEGKLYFQLTCGLGDVGGGDSDSPYMLGISGRRINDGSWHSVVLELNHNFSSLALDDSYIEQRRGWAYIQPFASDRTIYFGALVSPWDQNIITWYCSGSHIRDPNTLGI